MSDSLYISQLTSASSAALNDIIPATQGSSGPGTGTTRGVTLLQDLTALGLLPQVSAPVSTVWLPLLSGAGGTLSISPTSTMTWVASGGTTARTLGNRFSDVINPKDYGAVMDGVTNDAAAYQAARNAAVANYAGAGIVFVPPGGYNSSGGVPTGSGNVLWHFSGNTYGTGPYPVIGSGTDVVETVLAGGQKYIGRGASTVQYGSVMRIDQNITHTGGSGVTDALHIDSNIPSSGATLGTYVWAVNVVMTSSAAGACENVGISSTANRPANALADGLGPRGEIWAFVGAMSDSTGASANVAGAMTNLELDMGANNTDPYNYRLGIALNMSTQVSSGAAAQFGYGMRTETYGNASVGVGYSLIGTFYGAGFDTSAAVASGAAPAFRMASNQVIDFSGNGTRTLGYNSSGQLLQYQVNGSTVASFDQYGVLTAADIKLNGSAGILIGTSGAAGSVGIDFASATLSAAAVRLAQNQYIGFEINDLHTLGYVSATQALTYSVSGANAFTIGATGNAVASGSVTAGTSLFGQSSAVTGTAIASGGVVALNHLLLPGSPTVGFDATGATPTYAFRMGASQLFDLSGAGNRTFTYDTTADSWKFLVGGSSVFSVNHFGVITGADIVLNGASGIGISAPISGSVGIDFGGATLSTAAMRMAANQQIQFENTGVRTLRYNSTNQTLAYAAGGTDVFTVGTSGNTIATGTFVASGSVTGTGHNVGANQVVGARISGWGTSSNGTRGALNGSTATLAQTSAALAQLIIDLTTHGLIGT